MVPPVTSDEKAFIMNHIERTKVEFRRLVEDGREPPLSYWLDTMETLAMLGFEYGRKEVLDQWQKSQEKLERETLSRSTSRQISNSHSEG